MVSRKWRRALNGTAAAVHAVTAGVVLNEVRKNPRATTFPLVQRGFVDKKRTRFYDIGWLLPVFPALSVITHGTALLTDYEGGYYDTSLKAKLNPVRWLEYSVSSGILLWVLASLCGIVELRSLLSIVIANAVLQYLGYHIEKRKSEGAKKQELNALLATAWAVFLTIFIPITISFFTVLDLAEEDIPEGVKYAISVLWLLYASFGIAETLYAKDVGIKDYESLETVFLVLSLSSKLFLSLYATFGIFMPGSDEEPWFQRNKRGKKKSSL